MNSISQSRQIDSLKGQLNILKNDSLIVKDLYHLSAAYQNYKPDTAMLLARQAYDLSKKIKYVSGESWSLNQMAGALEKTANYSKALSYYIEQLKIEETREIPYNIATVNLNIALLYSEQDEFRKALFYAKVADSIIMVNNLHDLKLYSDINIGEIFRKLDQSDSAYVYTFRAYKAAVSINDSMMTGTSINNLANIFIKKKEPQNAINTYMEAMPYLKAFNNQDFICETTLGLAKAYEQLQRIDSCLHYARLSYVTAIVYGFENRKLDAASFLSSYFKSINNIDSAFYYQNIAIGLKDSIESKERTKQFQVIMIDEQLRQKEVSEAKILEIAERKERLQLLGIGIFIPLFFLISLFLSKRKVNVRVIEYSGIISLLLFFEYITLLLHPVVVEQTHHSPLLEIIIFVGIAAIVTPTHHRIQNWFNSKLTKNLKPIEAEPRKEEELKNTDEQDNIDQSVLIE